MHTLEKVNILNHELEDFMRISKKLKSMGVLPIIKSLINDSTKSHELTRIHRVKEKIKIYSKKRLEIKKASEHPAQRRLLNS